MNRVRLKTKDGETIDVIRNVVFEIRNKNILKFVVGRKY